MVLFYGLEEKKIIQFQPNRLWNHPSMAQLLVRDKSLEWNVAER